MLFLFYSITIQNFLPTYSPFIIYTFMSPYSMQFLVLSFLAVRPIGIRPFLQHIVALNWDPKSPNSCFSFKHALMPEFLVLSSVLLLKILTGCFQDEICEMLFSVSQQQQINGITLALVLQTCSKSQLHLNAVSLV